MVFYLNFLNKLFHEHLKHLVYVFLYYKIDNIILFQVLYNLVLIYKSFLRVLLNVLYLIMVYRQNLHLYVNFIFSPFNFNVITVTMYLYGKAS